MHFSHHRADQTLNVSSKVWPPWGPKSDLDPMFLTAALQSVGVELTRVVEVNCFRQALTRPIEINVLSGQELVLWQHCHTQRKGDRCCAGSLQTKVESRHRSSRNVNGQS